MNLRDIFEQTSSDWVRYTKYEIIEKDGVEWITPTKDSKIIIYNPLQSYEYLVQDMLNGGRLFCMEGMSHEVKKTLVEGIVTTYGLMGFMTAIPLNGNFMEYPHVFFGRNSFFDVDMMDTKDYIQYFQPFGVKKGQPKINGVQIPVTLLTDKTLEYGIVFSRNYAERVDWIIMLLQQIYSHFASCMLYNDTDNPALKSDYEKRISAFKEYGLGFKMRMTDKPTMVWDFISLKNTIETIYAVSISNKTSMLRMCKNCSKAFYAPHGRSEFCTDKCRNQYNVAKFREREKEKDNKKQN